MAHDRKLVLSGVSLTSARTNRSGLSVMAEIRDELEPLMIESGYLDGAPFKWVGLILRYGLKYEDKPHYQRIDKKYGDLPLAIELDTHDLIAADRAELKRLFMIATLTSLIHAGEKYARPAEAVDMLRERLVSVQAETSE